MERTLLRFLLLVCPAILCPAQLNEPGTSAEPRSKPLPSDEVADIEAWEQDEACSKKGSEQCSLSLRQLRGQVKTKEVREHTQQAKASRKSGRREPDDQVLGVPLYTHKEQARTAAYDDLGAGIEELPENDKARPKGWIVNMARVADKDMLEAGPDSATQPAVWFLQGTKEDLVKELQRTSSGIEFIEEDSILRAVPELEVGEEADADIDVLGDSPDENGDGVPDAVNENEPASWGLDRIDEREGLDHWYEHAGYGGKGTHVYMLDTGISTTHQDFGGRAIPTLEVNGDGLHECDKTNATCALDTLGHGTHTAGTVGGLRYGVAKATTLHACKTLDDRGSGMISWMVQALDWVIAFGERPAIISASLGGHYDSPSLTASIDRSVEGGVTVVVAAGNENDDACNFMPSKVPSTITVGAIAVGDARAPYSNYGSCVDIFAPGSAILSAGISSDFSTQSLSGTSMACPHVAGAVALLLAQDPRRTPADVRKLLVDQASADKVTDPTGSPNLLLYTNPPHPRAAPAELPPRFEVYNGPCVVDASGCVSNENFPKSYGNAEHCDILVHGDVGHMHVDTFNTERSFDTLIANFQRYSGSLEKGNAALLECVNPKGAITWTSDRTDVKGGWKVCPEKKPDPAAEATPGFFVACGGCSTDSAGCVTSPNYPMNYTSHGACYIDVVGDVEAIQVEDFDTEAFYDSLWVNGQNFSGSLGPEGIKPTEQLVWASDSDGNMRGWKLCPTAAAK